MESNTVEISVTSLLPQYYLHPETGQYLLKNPMVIVRLKYGPDHYTEVYHAANWDSTDKNSVREAVYATIDTPIDKKDFDVAWDVCIAEARARPEEAMFSCLRLTFD